MASAKPSSLVFGDRRVISCGDNAPPSPAAVSLRSALDQLRKLPEFFGGETKEKRSFEDRHESTRAYIGYMRPRCVEMACVQKMGGIRLSD